MFHDLHEEVMATTARGHSLISRVQQLEAEVPALEKDFRSLTHHSSIYTNGGYINQYSPFDYCLCLQYFTHR